MMEFDDRELKALSADLVAVTGKTHGATRAVFQEGASDIKKKWQANAKETAGTHGRLYPFSITWDEKFSTNLEFEVGPESDRPQGGMGPGFEFGSVNQRPHLDGQRAADEIVPLLERRIAVAAEDVFGDA